MIRRKDHEKIVQILISNIRTNVMDENNKCNMVLRYTRNSIKYWLYWGHLYVSQCLYVKCPLINFVSQGSTRKRRSCWVIFVFWYNAYLSAHLLLCGLLEIPNKFFSGSSFIMFVSDILSGIFYHKMSIMYCIEILTLNY